MQTSLFRHKPQVDDRKLRGGYYTPLGLARYLTNWAIRRRDERILEPSCGDGNFVVASIDRLRGLADEGESSGELVAIEVSDSELAAARERTRNPSASGPSLKFICADFFEAYRDLRRGTRFDVVIGNPPFIRFQHFDPTSRGLAFSHLRLLGYHPTKLANTWAAFVQLSIDLVRDGGRLAMVVPAELLQVNYASELRSRLAKQFEHIVLVGFRRLVFPEIQQEVLLLLAEGKRPGTQPARESDIHTIEFDDGEELLQVNDLGQKVAHMPSKHSRNGMKWTALFLGESDHQTLDLAQQHPALVRLGSVAEVDVGVVTGRNAFFVLDEETVESLGVEDVILPLVGRTSALKSIGFTKTDFASYRKLSPAFLLNLRGVPLRRFPAGLKRYIKTGEEQGVHRGYKCRIRPRWFDVPSVYVPSAFLFRQIHSYPLLVVNKARVTSTDTIHRVRIKRGVRGQQLAALAFNSLTLAWAEVCGRSYGGGVLELEPREAEELPVPYSPKPVVDFTTVDRLLREGRHTEALDYVDRVALVGLLGFDRRIVRQLRDAWITLRDRRINRR